MQITDYLRLMVEKGASDLIFSPGCPVLIKIREQQMPVDDDYRLTAEQVKDFAYRLMNEVQREIFERDWEINLGASANGYGRFRVNVMRQRGQVAMVIRYLVSTPPDFKTLHLPEELQDLILEKRGLILVAGATGAGKSTTLASMIEHRNRTVHSHILTIEDPIEYIYEYKKSVINQREIGTDTKSYADALKSAMREAPDVILIGEIRDSETMQQAINYSETGHLCLATIHASNAIETIDRVINFFPQENHKQLLTDLSHNLKAVICQRLIKGTKGNLWPAVEVLLESPYIKELIQKGEIEDIREAFYRDLEKDIISFDQSILNLYKLGRISKQQAIDHADSKHNMQVNIRLLESNRAVRDNNQLHYDGERP